MFRSFTCAALLSTYFFYENLARYNVIKSLVSVQIIHNAVDNDEVALLEVSSGGRTASCMKVFFTRVAQ